MLVHSGDHGTDLVPDDGSVDQLLFNSLELVNLRILRIDMRAYDLKTLFMPGLDVPSAIIIDETSINKESRIRQSDNCPTRAIRTELFQSLERWMISNPG